MTGIYITFEGTDGCGKSTQLGLLEKKLKSEGYDVLQTKEPGGTIAGQKIRDALYHPGEDLHPKAESLLFWADRIHHHETVVKPALRKGKIILGDRDLDSSWAYQCYARGLDTLWMKKIQYVVIGSFLPDVTLIYDITPATIMARIRNRHAKTRTQTRFDAEAEDFHARVREGFLKIQAANPERCKLINGELSKSAVFENTYEMVKKKLYERRDHQS